MLIPADADARTWIGGAIGALGGRDALHDIQIEILDEIGTQMFGLEPGTEVASHSADDIIAIGADPELRRQIVRLAVVLELADSALERSTTHDVEQFASALGVHTALVHEARAVANHHAVVLHADLARHSWVARETIRESLSGRIVELSRSKLAYMGIGHDDHLASKWRELRDLPEGTWGRGVAEFYERHGFPFPGEPHGIFDIGARHDFIHVLGDYDATPEGELETFGLIAATMDGDDGLTLLAVTLGIFQNGSIRHMMGKKVQMARSDTLSDPGTTRRWIDAIRRGVACNADLMGGIDHFAMAHLPLDEARRQVGLPPAVDRS